MYSCQLKSTASTSFTSSNFSSDWQIAEKNDLSWDVFVNLTILWKYSEIYGVVERSSAPCTTSQKLLPDEQEDSYPPDYTNISIVACQHGYNYKQEFYKSSVVTEVKQSKSKVYFQLHSPLQGHTCPLPWNSHSNTSLLHTAGHKATFHQLWSQQNVRVKQY